MKELLLLIQKLKLEALSSCRIAFLIPISLCLHPKEEKKMKSNKSNFKRKFVTPVGFSFT